MAADDPGSTWWEQAAYVCSCGEQFTVRRARWIDAEGDPAEAARVRAEGPLRGVCPGCARPATARAWWLEIDGRQRLATLHLEEHHRVDLTGILIEHLGDVRRRLADQASLPDWLLRPTWDFEDSPARRERPPVPSPLSVGSSSAAERAAEREELERMTSAMAAEMIGEPHDVDAAVPQAVGHSRRPELEASERPAVGDAYLATLSLVGEVVSIDVVLDEAGRRFWGSAALQARPIHLRGYGYPLVGVRVLASYVGESSLIDGVVDVGSAAAAAIFAALSRDFRAHLVFHSESEATPVRREVAASGLERNAALCIESARAALAGGDFAADARDQAMEQLFVAPLATRLVEAEHGLSIGDYRHLVSARETLHALAQLSSASEKNNLAILLEVEGLPVGEYEAIRTRVLAASLEFGLVAPRRFWRRIVASGLAPSLTAYAESLAQQRAASLQRGDDLDEAQRDAAWREILALCESRDLPRPKALLDALGPGIESRAPRRGGRSMSVSGEIRSRPARSAAPPVSPATRSDLDSLDRALAHPDTRLSAAIRALSSRADVEALERVLGHVEELTPEELLALLPSIAEMGSLAAPPLHARIDSREPHVRQAVAILLEFAGVEASIPVLAEALLAEDTAAWVDIARAIGSFGSRALGSLCQLLRTAPVGADTSNLQTRVAWAMGEICLGDSVSGGGNGQAAVEALAEAPEPLVALTARRGLATLHEVNAVGVHVRGEHAQLENSVIRGFARAAYEAIAVPELDVLEDEALDSIAVETLGT